MNGKRRYWSSRKGEGEGLRFLREHLSYNGVDCLIWPLFRKPDSGYGNVSIGGKVRRAHKVMCEMVNGPSPSPAHYAAHECGRGHEGCVHPKHLKWKTPTENQADCKIHGTVRKKGDRPRFTLTESQVAQIRAMKGQKTHAEIAAMYGVKDRVIGKILAGQQRGPDRVRHTFLEPEQVEQIKFLLIGRSAAAVASVMGINYNTVHRIKHGKTYL